MLESPLLPITARPGIHLLGAYVASISRLRVKNTTWARIYLYGTYVAMGWLAPNLNTTSKTVQCAIYSPLRVRLAIWHSACRTLRSDVMRLVESQYCDPALVSHSSECQGALRDNSNSFEYLEPK